MSFKLLFAGALLALSVLRTCYAWQTRQNLLESDQRDGLEVALLCWSSLGMFVLPVLYSVTSLLDFANYENPAGLAWSGAALLLIGLYLFWRSHADLGPNWSSTLQLRAGQQLVTQGIYRRIRHPMYAAAWLWSLGQFLLIGNWLIGPAALIGFAPLYWLRVDREEAMLTARFGEAYCSYIQRTGRLWPKSGNEEKANAGR